MNSAADHRELGSAARGIPGAPEIGKLAKIDDRRIGVLKAPWRPAGCQQKSVICEGGPRGIDRRLGGSIECDDPGTEAQLGAGPLGAAPNRIDSAALP